MTETILDNLSEQIKTVVSLNGSQNVRSISEADDFFGKNGFYRTSLEFESFDFAKAVYVRAKKKDVNLSYSNSSVNGPGQVVQSLLKGLQKLNVEVTSTSPNLGILQLTNSLIDRKTNNIVAGPNICVLPSEMPQIISGLKTFLVPSKWVYDKYVKDFEKIKKIDATFVSPELKIWSAGIDTDMWKPSGNSKSQQNCFIYFKGRTREELSLVKQVFKNQGMNVEVIEYGNYKPEKLHEICENSQFCVLLDNTESQGIAVMQILSMNVPIFVLDKTVWEYNGNNAPATSVPFFDERCGKIVGNSLSKKDVEDFFLKLSMFNPRQYILEHHTLVQAAGRYLECFK